MKKNYHFPRLVTGLAALLIAQTHISLAGFTSERLGITHVPLGGEKADKDLMETVEDNGEIYPPINEALSAADIAKLQNHKDFKGKTASEIQAKIVRIRRTVLCSIDMLKRSDPASAEGLRGLYRAGMISVGIAPEGYTAHAGIRDDGSKAFHLEPINLYEPPCESFGDWDAGLFDMINTLSNMAFYAQQDFKSSRDGTAQEVALDRQCKQVEASTAELDRVNEMLEVIESIKNNGKVPDTARGMFAAMGQSLINHNIANPGRMATDLEKWTRTLNGLKQKAEARIKYWRAQKRATELEIEGHASSGDVRMQLRQQTIFEDYGRNPLTGSINRWYTSVPTDIEELPGQPPRVVPGNMLQQLVPPATMPESFPVNNLDTICAGYVWEDQNKAFIGGIRFGMGGAADEGRVVTFDLDPTTKKIIPESERLSFGTPEMGGGYTMSFNPDDGKFYAMQHGNGIVCGFEDTDDDKEPDYAQLAGQFATGGLGLKADLSYFFFPQGDTAVAQEQRPDAPRNFNDRLAVTWRDHAGNFMPQPDEEFLDGLCERPGFDGLVGVGAQYLPLTGTPYGNFGLYDRGTMIASGCFSPHGHANPHLTNPISEDSELWIDDEKTGFESVRVKPQFSLGDIPRVQFSKREDLDLSVGIRYELNPGLSFKLEYGDSLEGISDNSVSPGFTNRAGWGYMLLDGSKSRTRFFRGRGEPLAGITPMPDNFEITPGLLNYFDVSKNDNAPPSARYELVEAPTVFGLPFSNMGFKFFPDGTFFIGFPTFAGSLSFKYRLCVGDYVSPDMVVFVAAFGGVNVINEPVPAGVDAEGNPLVEALFLEIGGLNYPLYQFRMGPPELITMLSGCLSIHWHGGPAYPIEDPFAIPITDPASTFCGFGTIDAIPIKAAILPKSVWDFFKTIHP